MAYQIKKADKITEDLELLDKNNDVALTIHIDIQIDRIVREYRQLQGELMEAQNMTSQGNEKAFEAFGNAVIKLFRCIFGDENTQKILEYFENNYMEMAVQCMPFISDVVQPAIEKYSRSKREIMANNYNLSRQQRRKLGIR